MIHRSYTHVKSNSIYKINLAKTAPVSTYMYVPRCLGLVSAQRMCFYNYMYIPSPNQQKKKLPTYEVII